MVAPLRSYLRERKPFAMHVMMWPLTVAGIIAGKLAWEKTRIITCEHSTLGRQYSESWWTLTSVSLTTKIFYPMASRILCVSNESADDLARLSGLNRGAIEVIYNPVASPTFPVVVPSSIEAEWGEDCIRISGIAVTNAKPLNDCFRELSEAIAARPAAKGTARSGNSITLPFRADLRAMNGKPGIINAGAKTWRWSRFAAR